MAYIGSSAAVTPVAFSGVNAQSFNGDGSTVAFTLNRPVSSVAAIEVVVNNVQQSPYDGSYSVSNTTLTFSAAPSTGTGNIYVVYRDFPVGSITDPNTYTKTQADTLLAGRVAKTGDTMSGELTFTKDVGNHITFQNANQTKFYGRVMVSDNNDAYGSGERIFFGDGNNDVVVGTGNSSGTPVNSFIALRHSGEVSIGAGGSAKHLVIDTAGRVTMPYQPAFKVHVSTSPTLASNSTIPFNVASYNIGGHFNTSTYQFTVPVSGVYIFGGNFRIEGSFSYLHSQAKVNGIIANNNGELPGLNSTPTTGGPGFSSGAIAYARYLNANDYIEFVINSPSGGTYVMHNQSYLFGYLHG